MSFAEWRGEEVQDCIRSGEGDKCVGLVAVEDGLAGREDEWGGSDCREGDSEGCESRDGPGQRPAVYPKTAAEIIPVPAMSAGLVLDREGTPSGEVRNRITVRAEKNASWLVSVWPMSQPAAAARAAMAASRIVNQVSRASGGMQRAAGRASG